MVSAEQTVDPVVAIASTLLGARVDSTLPVRGGRNSRVYRVESEGRRFALKRYPSRTEDPRDRLACEADALRLMAARGVSNVPGLIAVDPERDVAILSWLDGEPVTQVDDSDVDQVAAFIRTIHGMRRHAATEFHREAAETCLSGQEVETQIRRRLSALHAKCVGEAGLASFLRESFEPLLERVRDRARAKMAAAGLDFEETLPQEKRSLIPADFGFHNCLRRSDRTLVFLDFEYFGWDDPVKLTADVLLHPGTPLAPAQGERFRTAALAIYGEDASFAARLDALYPLFGLRWALIVLNEFLPNRWRLRVAAGETDSWTQAKTRQLSRARELVARTERIANG